MQAVPALELRLRQAAERVLTTSAPVVVDASFGSLAGEEDGKREHALLAVPVEVGGEVVAALCVGDAPGRRWEDIDVEVLEDLAVLGGGTGPEPRPAGSLVGPNRHAADVEIEAMLGRVLSDMQEAVFLLDPAHRITFVNRAFCPLIGCEADDIIGRTIWAIGAAAEAGEIQTLYHAMRETRQGGTWSGEITWKRPCGEAVPTRMTTSLVAADGKDVGGYVGILHGLEHDREQEENLRRARRLASMGTLLVGVSHELNGPLSACKNFAQILMRTPALGDEEREVLTTMQREVDRAAKIVADLRMVVHEDDDRIERGRVDLNEIVRHTIETRRYRLETLNVVVDEDLEAELDPVWADSSKIEQVTLNLVVNAEQAMAGQSEERRLVLCTRRSGRGAELVVGDSGPGVPPEKAERIFDPFYTSKAPGEGVGLGLSLVHSIVAAHNGTVRIETSDHGGAAFVVELPRARRTRPGTVEPVAETGETEGEKEGLRILLVDDEDAYRTSVATFMRMEKHEVVEARNGREAIELLEHESFDVILSDLRMPELGGDRLLARLKEMEGNLERRLIFFTGDTASSGATRLLSDADVPVVFKPFDLVEVETRVREHARRAGEAA